MKTHLKHFNIMLSILAFLLLITGSTLAQDDDEDNVPNDSVIVASSVS
jgi:hypothetical protein